MKKSLGPQTLAFPLPAYLVGTYDTDNRPNIMTAAWGGILASTPPCLGVSVQPPRWSHAAILKNQAFTVSFPSSKLAVEVDYAGIVSGKKFDKFKGASLTPVKSDLVNAPYVAECPVVAECRLYKTLELGSHTLFVGEILDIKADEGLELDGSALDIEKVDPLIFNRGGEYHRVGTGVGKAFSIGKSLIK
ncbi:MAG: flavin reductase family protein [Deltaproteobacteria bacterium]|jgi:flavin reductase (DIM6/NTAB) family NADH-FMN oxidoreductase RutF|nr:flavin reductase family protein [Deltaproteobacteria bacterium]